MDKLDAMTTQVRDFCDARDWRKYHTPNAANNVGCIHTVRSYDLNYGFVILDPDISYGPDKKAICARMRTSKMPSPRKRRAMKICRRLSSTPTASS